MKAKIISCKENTYWYKKLVGCVLDMEYNTNKCMEGGH